MPKSNNTSAIADLAPTQDDSPVDNVQQEHNLDPDERIYTSIRRKVDLRLCSCAGLLCSLNLLDSGILSSAGVTSMPADLSLTGDRFSVAIFIFTVASICAQLPATILMRLIGPPVFFSLTTCVFGLITLCTAFITSWKAMIALRVLLGIAMSGIYPGLTLLISTWYRRKEQQLRFAYLQSGEVIILATGGIVNYGLNHLDGRQNIPGWRWMYILQGSITILIGLITYVWIPHFPENAGKTPKFLDRHAIQIVLDRIDNDRKDAGAPEPFTLRAVLVPFSDPKLYAFAILFFLLNIVSTCLAYFTPSILQQGMGFSSNQAILLSAPPYYWSVVPVLVSSWVADKYRVRGPIITFNAVCLIVGFAMIGFPQQVTVRYLGIYLATGAYVSNWAALSSYQGNNITGQWKRATVAAAISACNGLGGIAGSYIVVAKEAPNYMTAVWVSISGHLLMIAIVLACTLSFWLANRRAKRGKSVIEGVQGFRYTY